MANKIVWDKTGERFYETGVDRGVLYVQDDQGKYPKGVAWNGLTGVTESPTGAEPNPLYADNIKYLNLFSVEEFEANIEAYTYPEEFEECDGSAELTPGVTLGQQPRKTFGLCYRTKLGNDLEGEDYGYKLHLIYGAKAAPSDKGYETINDTPDAITFSWDVTTTPVPVTGFKPTALLVVDSTKVNAEALATLENILYGTDNLDPYLPLPDEVAALFTGEAPDVLELSSIDPDDETTDVAIDADIVFTFNNKIAKESIVVTDSLGEMVVGTKTWDVTGKILTFNPTVDLANDTIYIVTISGVVDIYGQALASTVKNFETVSL